MIKNRKEKDKRQKRAREKKREISCAQVLLLLACSWTHRWGPSLYKASSVSQRSVIPSEITFPYLFWALLFLSLCLPFAQSCKLQRRERKEYGCDTQSSETSNSSQQAQSIKIKTFSFFCKIEFPKRRFSKPTNKSLWSKVHKCS